jgi:hypothetical protein
MLMTRMRFTAVLPRQLARADASQVAFA